MIKENRCRNKKIQEGEWKPFRRCGDRIAFINSSTGEIRVSNEYNEVECFNRQGRCVVRDTVTNEVLKKV